MPGEAVRDLHLDLGHAPYVLYGVKYIDLVSLHLLAGRVTEACDEWPVIPNRPTNG